eukprot:1157179-Pelagomonas_calceolata.AAC.12
MSSSEKSARLDYHRWLNPIRPLEITKPYVTHALNNLVARMRMRQHMHSLVSCEEMRRCRSDRGGQLPSSRGLQHLARWPGWP